MGNNCTNCCNNLEKKLRQLSSEDESELKIQTHRYKKPNNLSIIPEDAYESQLSQQNSHLGASMQIQLNSLNSLTTGLSTVNVNLINYWILDIQERYIIVSSVNEPNLLMKITVTQNEQNDEYCLFEELTIPQSNSANNSLNQINGNNNQSTANNSNNNCTPKNQTISADQLNYVANKKYFIYPFERQINEFYSHHFEKPENKSEKIYDFQSQDEVQFSIIESWKVILQKVFKLAGIQNNSNLIIVNNFLRFSRQNKQLNNISEMLLRFVFDKLKCARFTICSSGVPILKFINRKSGIVFDILDTGHIYCLPVSDGSSLDSRFRVIHFYINNFRDQNECSVIDQSNLAATNNTIIISGSMVYPKKNESLQKDIVDFLESLEPEFIRNIFCSRSIAVNNQCKNETVLTTVLYILNQYYLSLTQNVDDSVIQTSFQPILPKQPRNTRIFGAIDLVKLNAIETISKARYDRLGPVELIKQNLFL